MNKPAIVGKLYKNILKPIFFTQDPENVHNFITTIGEGIGGNSTASNITSNLLTYKNKSLEQKIDGIKFENPVGLSAGFDYDGHLAETMHYTGFGFNTIGTVTAQPYSGNTPPRLSRLPKSGSLLVNKGFKSDGALNVRNRLRTKNLLDKTIGVSIGSSNLPEVNTINAAIEDYIKGFETFKSERYVKYLELNISCPNTSMTESFSNKKNFQNLLDEISKLKIKKPIYVKMANELSLNETDTLVKVGIDSGMSGFIFSNLVKNRQNPKLDRDEIELIKDLKGNFSGKPTEISANNLIKHIYKEYGKHTTIIGCGGIFTAEDAYEKIKLGAHLIQLITGMVYNGPQIAAEINIGLIELMKKDGFKKISEAVGSAHHQ